MFSNFFESVFEPSSPTLSTWQPPTYYYKNNTTVLNNVQFDELTILKELKLLDPSKGPGPDGIAPIFLVNTACSIYVPLTIIFNKCMASGIFPSV